MQKLLEVKELKKTYYKKKVPFVVVDKVSFDVNKRSEERRVGKECL